MRTTFLICYDVANDKRLRQVFKICRNYGTHVQYSIFECDLNPTERIEIERKLGDAMKLDEDQVLFVSLGPADGRGSRVISTLGLPYTRMDAPCYIA